MENKPDKLKEIREKYKGKRGYFTNGQAIFEYADVEQIQSETYQLGREEVIKEIEEWLTEGDKITRVYTSRNIRFKLNELKESK